MRARFSGLTAIISLIALVLMLPVRADVGSSIKGGGGTTVNGMTGGVLPSGDVELRDSSQLGPELLTNGSFTGSGSWTRTNDIAYGTNNYVFTYSSGLASTLNQSSTIFTYLPANGWLRFQYTTSALSGTTPTCVINTPFVSSTIPMTLSPAATYTVFFQAASGLNSFEVSCQGGAAGSVTFDDFSVKPQGGDLIAQGQVLGGAGGPTRPGLSLVADPTTGLYNYSTTLAFAIQGTGRFNMGTSGVPYFTPLVTDSATIGLSSQTFAAAYVSRSIQGYKQKALTESAATNFVHIAVPSAALYGGEVLYTVQASDATPNRQMLSGSIRWSVVNPAGTETCPNPTEIGTPLLAANTGTLTCTWTCDTSPVNAVYLQANCVSSLTQTSLDLHYRLNLTLPTTITPQ